MLIPLSDSRAWQKSNPLLPCSQHIWKLLFEFCEVAKLATQTSLLVQNSKFITCDNAFYLVNFASLDLYNHMNKMALDLNKLCSIFYFVLVVKVGSCHNFVKMLVKLYLVTCVYLVLILCLLCSSHCSFPSAYYLPISTKRFMKT